MNTAHLSKYAPAARHAFINAVSSQAARLGITSQGNDPAQVQGDVLVVPVDGNTVNVTTVAPIVVNANGLELVAGIEALREVAGLPSISYSVPVTFSLTFRR